MEHAGIKEGKPERDAVAKNARAIFGRAKDLLGHPSLLLPSAPFCCVTFLFFLIFLFSACSVSLSHLVPKKVYLIGFLSKGVKYLRG